MSEQKIPTPSYLVKGEPCILRPRKTLTSRYHTPCGTGKVRKVDLSFDDKGNKIAKPGAILDLDAMIQAARPSTDMAAIVARAGMGDESVLNVHQNGFQGDSTELPRDIYDYKRMNDLYDKVSGSFNKLPDAVKALFNNSSESYLNAILSDQAGKIIKDFKDAEAAKAEKQKEAAKPEQKPAQEGDAK